MRYLSYFYPLGPKVLIYMLQQVEYSTSHFLNWVLKLPNLAHIMKRQRLDFTARATLTVIVAYMVWVGLITLSIAGFYITNNYLYLLLLVVIPIIIIITLALFNFAFTVLVVSPKERSEIAKAHKRLGTNNAVRIAVLGSYGKTTMKELLTVILGEGLHVASTPGNKNVLISHARWVNKQLSGSEDVLIFEYGEYNPGDIAKLARFSQPSHCLITGLSSAHLDNYKTLDAIADDFNAVFDICESKNVLVNAESPELMSRVESNVNTYSLLGVMGWKITNIKSELNGVSFNMKYKTKTLEIKSQLVGKHLVGPLAACVALADTLGLSKQQIEAGVSKTAPFEHRMRPYKLGPATIIDDTYNGNLEGMKAGLELLSRAEAKRKIYVTPGLVEQGNLTEQIHLDLGKHIAQASPDKVILMKNSVTKFIQKGLVAHNYRGVVTIESEPLAFYQNLEHFVAAGDVVLLQNDWSDQYS